MGKQGGRVPISLTPDAAHGLSSLPLSHPCSSPALGTDLPIVIADDLGEGLGRLLPAAPSNLSPVPLCQVSPCWSGNYQLATHTEFSPPCCYLVLTAGRKAIGPAPEPSLGKPPPPRCVSPSTSKAKERTVSRNPLEAASAQRMAWVSVLPAPTLCPPHCLSLRSAGGKYTSPGRKVRTILHNCPASGHVHVVDHVHGSTLSCATQWPCKI